MPLARIELAAFWDASFWSFLLKEGKLICPICCLFRDSCILLLYTLRDYIRGARLPPKPSLRTDVMYESLAFDVFPHNPHIDVVMTLESKVFMEYELCNKSLDAWITATSKLLWHTCTAGACNSSNSRVCKVAATRLTGTGGSTTKSWTKQLYGVTFSQEQG